MYKNINEYPDILTPNDIQKILRIGRNSTYDLLRNNELRSLRIGKKYLIPKAYLFIFLRSMSSVLCKCQNDGTISSSYGLVIDESEDCVQ